MNEDDCFSEVTEMKQYRKPTIEVELYEPCEDMASCEIVLTFGPEACPGYGFDEELQMKKRRSEGIAFNPFYDEITCECYVTAPAEHGYFSS